MQDKTSTEIFGEPISIYTRAQALEDGVLVDVSKTAREAGFTAPVALTRAVWADCVEWTQADTDRQTAQDEGGRLWDVLWLARWAARQVGAANTIRYTVYRVPRGGRAYLPRPTTLKLVCGPGDEGEPVITIMLPDED